MLVLYGQHYRKDQMRCCDLIVHTLTETTLILTAINETWNFENQNKKKCRMQKKKEIEIKYSSQMH